MPAEKVRIVLNRSTRSDEITDADIERLLRMPLYCKLPNEYVACIKAINSGTCSRPPIPGTLARRLPRSLLTLPACRGLKRRRGLFGMLLKPSMGGTNA